MNMENTEQQQEKQEQQSPDIVTIEATSRDDLDKQRKKMLEQRKAETPFVHIAEHNAGHFKQNIQFNKK